MITFNDTTMSEDGYPTEEYLAFLKAFDPFKYSIQDFLLTLGDAWWYGDWGYNLEGNHLVLATGGWSGNEDIIDALGSGMFHWLYWQSSHRGGRHEYTISQEHLDAQEHRNDDTKVIKFAIESEEPIKNFPRIATKQSDHLVAKGVKVYFQIVKSTLFLYREVDESDYKDLNWRAGKIGSTNREDGKPGKYNGVPCNILDADIDMLPLTDEYFPLSHIREYVKKKVKK